MKTILISLILLVITVRQDEKQIDTENSTVECIFTDRNVNGTIGDIQSESTLNWSAPKKSILKGSVAVTTLKTGNFLRDGHLVWDKYFNRSNYPRIYFESMAIEEKSTNTYSITGKLTVKVITKEVQLSAEKKANELELTGTIYTSDFDINISKRRSLPHWQK